MKEKQFVRSLIIQAAIIIAVYILVQIVSEVVLSDDYSEPLLTAGYQETIGVYSADDVDIQFDKDGIVSLKDIYMKDGQIWITLTPEKAGRVFMTVASKAEETSDNSLEVMLTVSWDGTITDEFTGNFSYHRLYHMYLVLLSLALSIFLWSAFIRSYRTLRYSYHSIFCSGMAMWLSLITLLLMVAWIRNAYMNTTYEILQNGAYMFMVCSGPFAILFGIAMSISNISLIRHEGFRVPNALGIIISLLVIGGTIFGIYIELLVIPRSELGKNLFTIFINIYDVVFAFMECFLIGAILCGTLAALHKPAYDKDYLIILGCKVRSDGTLYPLIRGRVDRAISFYREQLEKTGKKAVLVPSGGQGSDETLSEAAAMKRYLVGQGIEEKQILIEDQSKNTLQNMRFSRKLIEERTPNAKVAFSTTNYHVFRSGIISRQSDFEPDGMGSGTKWYFWPNAYMREAIGMLYYKWKSILVMLIPIVAFFFAVQHFY